MSHYFSELPFYLGLDDVYDPIGEIILYLDAHDKREEYAFVYNLLNKYMGNYLQLYFNNYCEYKKAKAASQNIELSTIVDENGNTLLHHFAMLGDCELVEIALNRLKIDVNAHNYGVDYFTDRDDKGKTALMCVVEMDWHGEWKQKYMDVCILLVQNNADWTRLFHLTEVDTYGINHRIKINKNNEYVYSNTDDNVIVLLEELNNKGLIDVNTKCVYRGRKRFGRRTCPERWGRRYSYYIIQHPMYMSGNYSFNKTVMYLAVWNRNLRLVNWLLRNGADFECNVEYLALPEPYITYLKKEYMFHKRKSALMVMENNVNNKYLSCPYVFREVLSYV
jgi:hypothetical protein